MFDKESKYKQWRKSYIKTHLGFSKHPIYKIPSDENDGYTPVLVDSIDLLRMKLIPPPINIKFIDFFTRFYDTLEIILKHEIKTGLTPQKFNEIMIKLNEKGIKTQKLKQEKIPILNKKLFDCIEELTNFVKHSKYKDEPFYELVIKLLNNNKHDDVNILFDKANEIIKQKKVENLEEVAECVETNMKVYPDFLILKKLGRGLYKNVYLAQREYDKKLFAFKFYDLTEQSHDILKAMKKTLEEIIISDTSIWLFEHNKPVNLSGTDKWKDNRGDYYLVEIPFEKNLEEFLNEKGDGLPVLEIYFIVKEIVEGISALHSRCRTHGDIKPANIGNRILSYEDGEIISKPGILVTDIGNSTIIEKANEICEDKMYFGSIDTRAPELFFGAKADSRSDVYSLGATAYWLFAGEFPFSSGKKKDLTPEERKEYDKNVEDNVKNPGNYEQLEKRIDEVFSDIKLAWLGQIVKECLKHDPKERPRSASEIKRKIKKWESDLTEAEEEIFFYTLEHMRRKR
jgi:hypothetical protein